MKIVVGLGNPDPQYSRNRHNIGFMLADRLAEHGGVSTWSSAHRGLAATVSIDGVKTLLLKPATYMNLSGESVRAAMDYYHVATDDLLVVYDDVSMDFGKVRYRAEGSAGGHNGIKSLIAHLGEVFPRIKIGVGAAPEHVPLEKWVLSDFTSEERSALSGTILPGVEDMVMKWLRGEKML